MSQAVPTTTEIPNVLDDFVIRVVSRTAPGLFPGRVMHRAALSAANFGDKESGATAVWGGRGDYYGQIKCVESSAIVIDAGPEHEACDAFAAEIVRRF